MKNLETSSSKQLKTTPNLIPWRVIIVFIIAGLVGFLDSVYLTAKHYTGGPINCTVFDGCDIVIQSKYSTIWNLPISLAGAVYYLLVLALTFIYLELRKPKFLKFAAFLAFAGFGFSLWLLYLQLFVIGALCAYCLLSLATSAALFVGGLAVLRSQK